MRATQTQTVCHKRWAWVDQMVRCTNTFVERPTFFRHRHWAHSRESVATPQLLMTHTQIDYRSCLDAVPAAAIGSATSGLPRSIRLADIRAGETATRAGPRSAASGTPSVFGSHRAVTE